MIKNLSQSLFLLCLLFSVTSQALPILQADAFTEGDNKAALEIDTGLIWMDFGVNSDRSYADVTTSLSTDFVGWRLPNVQEVSHLWAGLFGNLPEWNYFSNSIGIMSSMEHDEYFSQLYAVFGFNADMTYLSNDMDGNTYETWVAKSMFGVFETSPQNFGIVSANSPYDEIHRNEAIFLSAVNADASSWYGTLLIKDPVTVPEPGALSLLLLGLLGLAFKRIRKN